MRSILQSINVTLVVLVAATGAFGGDFLHDLQRDAIQQVHSKAAHWGWDPLVYTLSRTHSNRLIPVYTFGTKGAGGGMDLDHFTGANSLYRSQEKITRLYHRLTRHTHNPAADYLDQTNIFDIQRTALERGKKHIFLVVFDGMDWQTTRAAAIFNRRAVDYSAGRGSGTHFQDYQAAATSQFGFMVTSPDNEGTKVDVNQQSVINPGGLLGGGYDAARGGPTPWTSGSDDQYLVSRPEDAEDRHPYTDSASAAVSMMAGIKTYNNAINVDPHGTPVLTIAHLAQQAGYAVGVVSSVPFSHATPAAAYAHNVHRNDYQDLSRDMLGLPSISHPDTPLPGLDVVIGGGYGVDREEDAAQGDNFVVGNVYLNDTDLKQVDVLHGGHYVVARRTAGIPGSAHLQRAVDEATRTSKRLFGFYGVGTAKGHLPFQTADGDYHSTLGRQNTAETYTAGDLDENPTLAEMTQAALTVLSKPDDGLWLLVEPGDVDWANHDNNLDNAIGAVNSGDEAVKVITDWVEMHSNWDESLLIVTADHGHYLFLDCPDLLIRPVNDP